MHFSIRHPSKCGQMAFNDHGLSEYHSKIYLQGNNIAEDAIMMIFFPSLNLAWLMVLSCVSDQNKRSSLQYNNEYEVCIKEETGRRNTLIDKEGTFCSSLYTIRHTKIVCSANQ